MKQNILVVSSLVTLLTFGLSCNVANAARNSDSIKDKVKQIFTKEHSNEDLLNLLVEIDRDIANDDMESLRGRASELKAYMSSRDNDVVKHDKKYSDNETKGTYTGDRVLEVKYGKWPNSHKIMLPLAIKSKPLAVDLRKNKELFYSFTENEIENTEVRYVRYDVGNKKAGSDLYKLLSSVKKADSKAVRDNMSNLYEDILIDHEGKVSLVSKIRDNLAVAKYMLDNNQPKAAQNTVGATDSLMLRLIGLRSDSPAEQQKIRNLRRDLDNTKKVSDAKYMSEWERVPGEIDDMWNKM